MLYGYGTFMGRRPRAKRREQIYSIITHHQRLVIVRANYKRLVVGLIFALTGSLFDILLIELRLLGWKLGFCCFRACLPTRLSSSTMGPQAASGAPEIAQKWKIVAGATGLLAALTKHV